MAANPQQPPIVWGGAPSAPTTYCNSVQILISPYEFSFELGQLSPVIGEPMPDNPGLSQATVVKTVIARLAMSPQHAKAFSKVLADNVSQYEAQFGEVPTIDVQSLPGAADGGQ